jgi:perosamine synthetase
MLPNNKNLINPHNRLKIMNKWKIPLYRVNTNKEDVRAVSNVISRGMDWANGPEILDFEKNLSNYVGTKYCVTFNSGTSALHASLLASGISLNDEVIVPSFSFIATVNSVLMVNAKPVFVDIENERFGIDPKKIESLISKKTKAIIPVHYAGLACKIKEISDICRENNLTLIEDAAESLGSTTDNKPVGQFGDLSVFSFAGNKVLTTGEGGAVVTNSKKLFDKLILLRSHGRKELTNYFTSNSNPEYVSLGYNWRISSMTAALANSQLRRLNKLIDMRRKNAKYLTSKLKQIKEIQVPYESQFDKHVFQIYSIVLVNSKLRNGLLKHLTQKGIMTKIFFLPIHKSKFYKSLKLNNLQFLTNTEKISNSILSLPMYPDLKKDELNYISDSIKEFFESKSN